MAKTLIKVEVNVPYGMGADNRYYGFACLLAYLTGTTFGRHHPDGYTWYAIRNDNDSIRNEGK